MRLAFIVSLGEPMTDLDSLALFAKVVEAGSFSEAARRLKTPISTVNAGLLSSRTNRGSQLLERSNRNLRPDRVRRRGPRARRAERGAERSCRERRFQSALGRFRNLEALSPAERFRHPADAAGHRVSGVLSERPRPDPCHRASGRSHRRGRRLGVSSGRTEGFMPGGATGLDLSPPACREPVLFEDVQTAERTAGPSRPSVADFLSLEARE